MDEIEQLAEAIFKASPFTVDGATPDWAEVVRAHPAKATEYRTAAQNRMRAEKAMQQMDRPRAGTASAQ